MQLRDNKFLEYASPTLDRKKYYNLHFNLVYNI